jgi:hypothetical protein
LTDKRHRFLPARKSRSSIKTRATFSSRFWPASMMSLGCRNLFGTCRTACLASAVMTRRHQNSFADHLSRHSVVIDKMTSMTFLHINAPTAYRRLKGLQGKIQGGPLLYLRPSMRTKAGILHNAAIALCHSGSIEPKPCPNYWSRRSAVCCMLA